MALSLCVIAHERSTEFRLQLLDLWIHHYCRKVWYWDATMELWCQRWELDPEKHMSEDESELYDQLVAETTVAALLGLEEVPVDLERHGPSVDVF